jgi:hypothetical protein
MTPRRVGDKEGEGDQDEKSELQAHSTLLEEEIKKRTTHLGGARLKAMCA